MVESSNSRVWRVWEYSITLNEEMKKPINEIIFQTYLKNKPDIRKFLTTNLQKYSKDELTELIFPVSKSTFAGDWRLTLIKFAFDIQIGDLIIVYDWKKEALKFVGLAGDYLYNEKTDTHIRKIEWLGLNSVKVNDFEIISEIRIDQSQAIRNIDGIGPEILRILNDQDIQHSFQILGNANLKNKGYSNLKNILYEFIEHTHSEQFEYEMEDQERDSLELKGFIDQLENMDKSSEEFENHVLYGLLPCHDTSFTIRKSRFPVFLNIKKFFEKYNYDEQDWMNVANFVYKLVFNFVSEPVKLKDHIKEFTNSNYSKGLQCGSITPIFSALVPGFPIVNNRTINTYAHIMNILLPGKRRRLSQKLKDYPKNIKLINELLNMLDVDILQEMRVFDYFVYWYDNRIKSLDSQTERRVLQLESVNTTEDETEEEIETVIEDFDLLQYLDSLESGKNKINQYYTLATPNRLAIYELIRHCEKTNWVLPYFQRYFDWNTKNVKELWESIFKNYYIGSFLLWDSRRRTQLGTIPILGAPNTNNDPDKIILDGQQRITSIYYAIQTPSIPIKGSKSEMYYYFRISSFLNNEDEIIEIHTRKLPNTEAFKKFLFPLYELEDSDAWLIEMKNYFVQELREDNTLSSEDREQYRDKIDFIQREISQKLNHVWRRYEIPYITLPENLDLGQVTDIFENLNSKGKALSVFDLLIARLFKYNIEIKGMWDAVLDNYPNIKRYYIKRTSKMPIYVLQSMSLRYHPSNSAKRKDILDIYENIYSKDERDFIEDWDLATEYMENALQKIENCIDGFGVISEKHVPYISMIPVLSALLWLINDKKEKLNQGHKKIQMWYWSAIFTNAYSSAAESQMSRDYRDVKKWIFEDQNDLPQVVNSARKQILNINLLEIQSSSSAKYLGLLGLFSLKKALDFNKALAPGNSDNNEKDHIFPKAFDYPFGTKSLMNCIVNITWNSKVTNRDLKSAKSPSTYLSQFLTNQYNNDETELCRILETHFINKKAYEYMKIDNFLGFLEERKTEILKELANRVGIELAVDAIPSIVQPDTPFTNRLVVKNKLRTINGTLLLLDKYFRINGLELLNTAIDPEVVKEIKILTSYHYADEEFRKLFKDLKKEFHNKGVELNLHVIIDNKDYGAIHDRFFIGDNIAYNAISLDISKRGQLSEITESENRDELERNFNKYWGSSKDLINDWNKIKKIRTDKLKLKS